MSAESFTADNTAMLLIDHQVGTMGWVRSIEFEQMKANALALANTAKAVGIPLVLTSSMEEYAQGPLLSELADIAPEEFEARVKRLGVVNAMDDENFAAAVRETGRKKLIIAGVTNDVCTVYPTLTALQLGYDVQVVADAGGSPTKAADDIAIRRMENAGATITSTIQLMAELAQNWTSERGGKIIPFVMGLMPQQ
ncbi:isochorismatase family protein [Streptomyces diastatochromogenes]|uniref:Isochorismatase n=1 Tax=Streptomyces diastatochromogenes TaxID=42236 RepID=A0A233RV49_STRDA|nr:isochorismatase family protein [Streptomyces diastatochromogenes]MCZ0985730.1 isochorismatase family protein [Streptomyces diastatochromogenes]OXY87275.1 isochorismatase [Streptomyces diastatochromogenes]